MISGLHPLRHLHAHREARYTLCGWARWVPVRTGSRVVREPGHPSVHWSKARKSDCPNCRALARAMATSGRIVKRRAVPEVPDAPVTILSVRQAPPAPRASFLPGEVYLAAVYWVGEVMAQNIVDRLKTGPHLPAERR